MAAPVKVSPLIRVSRYAALVAGIFYGFTRNNQLQAFEDERRAQRDKIRPAWEAQRRAEHEASMIAEMEYLGEAMGVDMVAQAGLVRKQSSQSSVDDNPCCKK